MKRTLPSALATVAVVALTAGVGVVTLTAGAHPQAQPVGAHQHHGGPAAGARSVTDLTGPRAGTPDVRFVLTARTATVTLDSGRRIEALTFDGTAPGPELRVQEGRLVEVVLRNADVTEGVTLHWHGLDVPNAEDGVAGVTQDAVPPGGEHVYRFRSDQVGTFWYHSHQDSARTVARGLYGAMVVLPASDPGPPPDIDEVLLGHAWPTGPGQEPVYAVGTADGLSRRDAPAGSRVRLRLTNTDSLTQHWTVDGTSFRVVAVDGVEVHQPTPLDGARLRLPAGGRYDVEFIAPPTPVRVGLLEGDRPGVVFSPAGTGDAPAVREDGPLFDPLGYGSPAPAPFTAAGPFDRDLVQVLDTVRVTRRGVPGVVWTINGKLHDDLRPAVVTEGDLVRVTIRNDGADSHPMHLHGHHALVLSRNGVPATGSPWWTDTLGVEPGDEFVIAFRADNPGIWMDHCHNLGHAAAGMVMHLLYEGVSTPFSAGSGTGNTPE